MSLEPESPRYGAAGFAPIFAGLMVLWPLLAVLGGQGFSILAGLAGLASIAWLRWPGRFPLTALVILVLVGWVSVTTAWSPAMEGDLISGNVFDGTFSLEVSALRLIGIALAGIGAIAVAMRLAPGRPRWAAKVLIGVLVVHLLISLAMPVISGPLLELAYDDPHSAARDGIQNMLRAINAMALFLPLLTALLWTLGLTGRLAAAALTLLTAAVFGYLGSSAAVLCILLAPLCVLLVVLLPRNGFRVLFATMGAIVLAAPGLGLLAGLVERMGIVLPASFQSRLWAWETVTGKLAERPITGHGIEAASTWRETYASHPDWLAMIVAQGGVESAWQRYPVVPSHPHNMGLEIWAETGLIGAVLAAATLILIGWRLPRPEEMSPYMRLGLAGLAGGGLSLFSFSYSAWNEAFWANLVLAGVCLILIDRGRRA